MTDWNYDANGNPIGGAAGPSLPPKRGLPMLWVVLGGLALWYFIARRKG